MKKIQCPMCGARFPSPQSKVAAKAGRVKSAAKTAACRANGAKGGRPRKIQPPAAA